MHNFDAAIREHRSTNATVTLTHNGAPLANRDVVVQQKQHRFQLGANWGEAIALVNGALSGKAKELAEQRNHHFLQLFNQVTLPFYWARFEPQRGQPQTEPIMNAARWYKDNGCLVKGHTLVWHTLTVDWLLDMTNQEIREAQVARIHRDVADFAGVIDSWDVINEPVIMPIYDRYDNGITRLCKELGRIEMIRTMFDAARETNPNAVLLINDFDTSPAYDILVEGCLKAGIQIDAIGIQSHMHQGYWGVEKTLRILERFERFNLPLHFTENTIVSGDLMPPEIGDLNDFQPSEWNSTPEGEARQAEEVMLHYKSLLANPAVESITWWDFTDGAWLNAPAGLLRRDQTPKPAYDELMKLVKGEWWLSPTTMTTDTNGQLSFTGFLGEYEVSAGNDKATFTLNDKGTSAVSVKL